MEFNIANDYKNPPASKRDLMSIKQAFPEIPKEMIRFWTFTNGVENIYDQKIFSVSDTIFQNDLLNVKIHDPFYMLIGFDGEKGLLIKLSDHGDQLDKRLYALDLNYLGEIKPAIIADSFRGWLRQNFGVLVSDDKGSGML